MLTCDERKQLFLEILNDLKTSDNLSNSEFAVILSLNRLNAYHGIYPDGFDENAYIHDISSMLVLHNNFDDRFLYFGEDSENKGFIDKIKKECSTIFINKICNELKMYSDSEDYVNFDNLLNRDFKEIIVIQKDVNQNVHDFMKRNHWFINIGGSISVAKWRIAHSVCDFSRPYQNIRDELRDFLERLKNENKDNEIFERSIILLRTYFETK